MGGEKLWENPLFPLRKILVLFRFFNAYETVDEFDTFCEKAFVTRSWQDNENIFLRFEYIYRVEERTWSPPALFVIIFTHIDNLLRVHGKF